MILDCPLCRTRYLVQANLFAGGARIVRCARCHHSWKADVPNAIDVVDAPSPDAAPVPSAVPPGSNLPAIAKTPYQKLMMRVRQALIGLVFLAAGTWLILDRQAVAHRWHFFTPLYDALHLSVAYPGEELEFNQVRSELKFDGGMTRLVLEGKISNKTKNRQKVPDIVAEALGPDGQVIQSWQIDAPASTLSPGEEVGFSSSILAPKGSAVNINLSFAEMKE